MEARTNQSIYIYTYDKEEISYLILGWETIVKNICDKNTSWIMNIIKADGQVGRFIITQTKNDSSTKHILCTISNGTNEYTQKEN